MDRTTGLVRRSRPAHTRQQPSHHSLEWITLAVLKFVLLDGLLAKAAACSVVWRLSFGRAIRWRMIFRRVS
jgi:hypothetical protein